MTDTTDRLCCTNAFVIVVINNCLLISALIALLNRQLFSCFANCRAPILGIDDALRIGDALRIDDALRIGDALRPQLEGSSHFVSAQRCTFVLELVLPHVFYGAVIVDLFLL